MHGRSKRSGRSGFGGPLFHSNKKKKFLVGYHQCYTAWQRKSLKCSTDSCFHQSTRLETRYSGARDETNTRNGDRATVRRLTHEFEWRGRDGDDVLAAENEAVTELKNRKVRSGSVAQSTKVLREPIQIAEKVKVK